MNGDELNSMRNLQRAGKKSRKEPRLKKSTIGKISPCETLHSGYSQAVMKVESIFKTWARRNKKRERILRENLEQIGVLKVP